MSKFSSRGSVTQPHPAPPPLLEPGVPRALAVWRATRYRDLRYALTLTIDLARELAFVTVEIEVTLPDPVCAVVFDLRGDAACVRTAKVNGAEVEVASVAEHLVIDAATL